MKAAFVFIIVILGALFVNDSNADAPSYTYLETYIDHKEQPYERFQQRYQKYEAGDVSRFGVGFAGSFSVTDHIHVFGSINMPAKRQYELTSQDKKIKDKRHHIEHKGVRDEMPTYTAGIGFNGSLGEEGSYHANIGYARISVVDRVTIGDTYYWQHEQEFSYFETLPFNRSEKAIFAGVGLRYNVLADLELSLDARRYQSDAEDIDQLQLGVKYALGNGLGLLGRAIRTDSTTTYHLGVRLEF